MMVISPIFSVLSVSGAAPPWSECSQSPPPTIPCHGAPCHYAGDTEPLCWGHRSIGAGPRHETSGHHRLVPGSAHYPPGRRPATVSQQIFFVRYRKYFSCSPSHREPSVCRHPQLPSNIQHSICHIEYYSLFSLHLQHKNVPALSLQFCEASA